MVAGDDERHRRLVDFARDFTARNLDALAAGGPRSITTFVPGASHPLGTLAAWPIADVLSPARQARAAAG